APRSSAPPSAPRRHAGERCVFRERSAPGSGRADQHCDRLASPRLSWERLDAPMMSDVFALSDEYVMCWSAIGDTQLFYVFDGARTRPIPAPASWILGVHGCAPDWIVAVGEHGTRPAGMERH